MIPYMKRGLAGWAVVLVGAVAIVSPVLAAGGQRLTEAHRAAGLKCVACHQESPPKATPSSAVCTGCHGDLPQIIEKTARLTPNPHASPHLEPGQTQACTECHHVHKPSEVTCTQCHQDFHFDGK